MRDLSSPRTHASAQTRARGAAALDVQAIANTARTLAAMMLADAELLEIDINPLVVRPAGQGVEALDALLVFNR